MPKFQVTMRTRTCAFLTIPGATLLIPDGMCLHGLDYLLGLPPCNLRIAHWYQDGTSETVHIGDLWVLLFLLPLWFGIASIVVRAREQAQTATPWKGAIVLSSSSAAYTALFWHWGIGASFFACDFVGSFLDIHSIHALWATSAMLGPYLFVGWSGLLLGLFVLDGLKCKGWQRLGHASFAAYFLWHYSVLVANNAWRFA